MSGYRRIISYIYVYEKGERRGNSGFVKLETRDGEYRLTVQLKKNLQRQGSYKLYLYAPGNGQLRGMYLGELNQTAGAREWRGSIEEKALYSIADRPDQTQGILIEGPGQIRYAAQWEDAPVAVDSFRVYPNAGMEGKGTKSAGDKGAADRPGISAGDREEREPGSRVLQVSPKSEDGKTGETPESGRREPEGGLEAGEKEPERRLEAGEGEPEGRAEAGERESEGRAEAGERQFQERPEAAEQVFEEEAQSLEEGAREKPESEGTGIEENPGEQPGDEMAAQETEPDIPYESAAAGRMDSRQEKWAYLMRHFPVQKLFQSEGPPMDCIRIGPRDLQRLPRENWVLGNNSFLFHGYYQYRHLLLCRQEEKGKSEFYLGVPGVYNERERMMAELFGFGEFRRSRNMGNRNGNFGYWFRRLEEA